MRRVLILVALFGVFLIPAPARACGCLTGPPPYEYNRAKMVFIGRMLGGTEKLSLKNQDGKSSSIEAGMVRFAVEEVFKGEATDKVTIEIESMDGTSCGPYGLRRGERYVVYAYAYKPDARVLSSGACTRTMPVSSDYAKADLDFLSNLPPPGVGGNLRGRVWADLRDEKETPLANVRVKIRGAEDRVITAITNDQGDFEFRLIRPGKYRVEPELPPNYTTEHRFEEVTVDDRGTARVDFEACLDGRVSGRVVDKDGHPSNSVSIELVGEDKKVYGEATGENGEFVVEGVPPGEYVLSIEMEHERYEPRSNFYYPGTYKREEATIIKIGLGEKIEGLEFSLPGEFKVRTINGQVVWPDGRPAANATVVLVCPQSSKPNGFIVDAIAATTQTDEGGRFQLEAFTGETYWLDARGIIKGSKSDEDIELNSRGRRVSTGDHLKDLRIVLSESKFSGGCGK